MDDDRAILIGALNVAMRAYEKLNPRRTLLGTRVDESVLEPLSAAIEKCAAYQTVAGQVLFSGGSGPILHSPSLASRVFSKVQYGDDVSKAADWLLRILTTRQAKALFKAAIWGLDLSEEIALGPTTRLMPFASLHDSYMKRRILERAKPCYDKSAWISQRYFDVPLAAFVEEVPTFPYIGSDGACFREMQKLQWKAHDMSILIQGTSVGRPIAVACWFEYANQDLEYAEWENQLTWLLPEIPPYVKTNVPELLPVSWTPR